MKIEITKLTESATIPTQGSVDAAGYDLYADIVDESDSVEILPNETKVVHTGIAMAIPQGYFGGVYARSGLSIKNGLRPANCTGVIDSDYRGELLVALHNDSDTVYSVTQALRIAQLIIQKFESVDFVEVPILDTTDRGEGGLGSTGLK